jgi:hypothetical protein
MFIFYTLALAPTNIMWGGIIALSVVLALLTGYYIAKDYTETIEVK